MTTEKQKERMFEYYMKSTRSFVSMIDGWLDVAFLLFLWFMEWTTLFWVIFILYVLTAIRKGYILMRIEKKVFGEKL